MSLSRNILITAGDVLRLLSDLMQYKVEAQTKVIKRGIGRLVMCLAVCMASLVLAGAGVGFILYGAFVLVAGAIRSPGAAGLIVGFVVLLVAVVGALAGWSLASRS